MNYFALCSNEGTLVVKRIPLTNPVQRRMDIIFESQEESFRRGITDEVAFAGDWNPDAHELLTLEVTPEATLMINALNGNALALDPLNTAEFENENIKAVFTGTTANNNTKVLVQRFISSQLLNKRFALFMHNNTFTELTAPSFTLGTKLTCIIENERVKFKSYSNLRMIMDLTGFYQEATNEDIDDFSEHEKLEIEDLDQFKQEANQPIRKLVHKIMGSGVLDQHSVRIIRERAQSTGLDITVRNGRIQFPEDKTEIRLFLQFLDDGLYDAPLSGQRYITNSKRAV